MTFQIGRGRAVVAGLPVWLTMSMFACGTPAEKVEPDPVHSPNIILFLADDHGQ